VISAADTGGEPGRRAPARPAFLDSTWYLLAKTGALAKQRWAAMLADFDVSPSQNKVLMTLGETGPVCQQFLAELIGVDPRNTVPIVESLVERGLVGREVDPADRRRRVLDLTPAGREITGQLASIGAEIERDILSPLSPADQTRLRRMLLEILDAPAGALRRPEG
jgi:MarR family transcriptional regulator, temperature-dependent positive regulator of motility